MRMRARAAATRHAAAVRRRVRLMETLADDLALLAVGLECGDHFSGISTTSRLRFALRGAELIELAKAGRIDVPQRVTVIDATRTADPALDAALDSLDPRTNGGRRWNPGAWVHDA